jgi:hypothetical protein
VLPDHFRWLVNMVPETEPRAGDLLWMPQRPEINELIAKAPLPAGRILRPLCKMLGVEPPPALRLPLRLTVRIPEEPSEPAPTVTEPLRAQPAHDGDWPLWRGSGLLCPGEARFWKFQSKNSV